MSTLRLIGYWRSLDEPELPDPAWFVDPDWDPAVRTRVATYLRSAHVPAVAMGVSWCRFRCGIGPNGSAEHTDGRFLWPQGLAHYVEAHAVRLPDEFVQVALSGEAPRRVALRPGTKADSIWWAAQRGFREGESFLTELPRGRFVAHLRGAEPTPPLLHALRQFYATRELSLDEVRQHIESGTDLVLMREQWATPRPPAITALEQLGLHISFVEQ